MVLLLGGIVAVAVWGPGLWWLLRHPDGRRFRALGIAAIATTIIVLLEGGKPYYLAPTFIPCSPPGRWARREVGDPPPPDGGVAAGRVAIVALPLTAPVLPAERLDALHAVNPIFEDMVGWPDFLSQTRAAWATLPADERAHAVVVTANYGEAGVLLRDAPELPVYSGHNSLWFEGPPPASGHHRPGTSATGTRATKRRLQLASRRSPRHQRRGVHNEELGRAIFVCRGLTKPWAELWPKLKHFE